MAGTNPDWSAPGASATAPLRLPWAAWRRVLARCWAMNGFHNLSLLAAGVAFFCFLSITPLIASTVLVYGLIADTATVADTMRAVIAVVPADAARLIEDQLISVVTTSGEVTGVALLLALFFAIYGAMRAATGLIGALNIINEEHETRSMLRQTLIALGITLTAIGIGVTGLAAASIFALLRTAIGFVDDRFVNDILQVVTWGSAFLLGSLGMGVMYRYGPDRAPARWRWLTPGSALATALWLAVSIGFSLYVTYIANYSATYGSLAAIVVALMWLFLSAYAILIGALLNVEIERQTLVDTTTGPARPIGQRGAVVADDVAVGATAAENLSAKRAARRATRRAVAIQAEPTD